ncbi:unnamed protein product [Camellia sinensis]
MDEQKKVFTKVEQLRPQVEGLNLTVKVVNSKMILSKGRANGNQGRQMRLAECLVGDETGMIIFTARNDQVVTIVTISVAVMTRTYPEDSGEWKELNLLQNIASYMLLACGAVYLISCCKWENTCGPKMLMSKIANNQPGCVRGVLHALDYHHCHYNVKKLLPHKKHNGPRHVKGGQGVLIFVGTLVVGWDDN